MEEILRLLDQVEKSEDKKVSFEKYSEILEALKEVSQKFSPIFRVVDDVVRKVNEFKSGDLTLQAHQTESALRIFQYIEQNFKQNLGVELSLVSSTYEKNIIEYIGSHGPLPLQTIFKQHIMNPYLNIKVFKSFSIFDAVVKYLRKHAEKYFELAELLLDPEFKTYEYYNDLKFMFFNILTSRIVTFCQNEKDASEKIKYKNLDDSILILLNQNNQYRIQYQDSPNQFELFLFDLNVFLSLNKFFSTIRLNSIESNNKLKTVSLSFDNFGKSLFDYLSTGAFKKNSLNNQQILFIIKLIAESALELLNNKVYIKCLHPWNIFLLNDQVSILPYSYFEQCFRGEWTNYKVFCCKNKECDLETRLAYSLGVIFIYFKDQTVSSYSFEKQKDNVLISCENEISNFVEKLLSTRKKINLRDVLDLLIV